MLCINPIRMRNPNYPESSSLKFIDCACGKCFNCLVNRRRMWYFRLFYESLNCGSSYFVTLDVSPRYDDSLLHKDHLQSFFKSLRKLDISFSYYAIGEFGTDEDKTHRPHYHVIFFFKENYIRSFVDLFCRENWKYGFVDTGYVNPKSINYILHYHVRPKRPFNDDRKTFSLFSKGLGLSFLDDHLIELLPMLVSSTQRFVVNSLGESFVLPRYYVKKFKEYGLDIKEFDGSNIDWSQSRLRDILSKIDDTLEYYPDGRVKESSSERWNSLVSDLLLESKRKLSRYDLQKKYSS